MEAFSYNDKDNFKDSGAVEQLWGSTLYMVKHDIRKYPVELRETY